MSMPTVTADRRDGTSDTCVTLGVATGSFPTVTGTALLP